MPRTASCLPHFALNVRPPALSHHAQYGQHIGSRFRVDPKLVELAREARCNDLLAFWIEALQTSLELDLRDAFGSSETR